MSITCQQKKQLTIWPRPITLSKLRFPSSGKMGTFSTEQLWAASPCPLPLLFPILSLASTWLLTFFPFHAPFPLLQHGQYLNTKMLPATPTANLSIFDVAFERKQF